MSHYRDIGIPLLFELINEPNANSNEYGGLDNATAYAELVKVVGAAVRAAAAGNDQIWFVGAETENIDVPWLQVIFEHGALRYFDAVTVHPYRSDAPETFLDDLVSLRALVREYAPLNDTAPLPASGEWGYDQTRLGPVTTQNTTQGELFARQMLVTIPFTGMPSIWYEWHDEPNEFMGVVDATYHTHRTPPYDPKPAYVAAQALSHILGGFAFDSVVPVYQNGMATWDDNVLRFYNSDGDTAIAAWTSGSFQHVIRLPGGAGCWNVYSWLGHQLPDICEDPRGIHLNVSSAPLYLVQRDHSTGLSVSSRHGMGREFAGTDVPALLGVNPHVSEWLPGELDMLYSAGDGFNWVRTDILWPVVEAQPGVYNFSQLEDLFGELAAREMGFIAITSDSNPLYDNGAPIFSDEGRKAYANFAAALAQHFGSRGGQIAIELVNEPNAGPYAGSANASLYAKLATVVGPAVHAVNASNVYFVGPASSNIDMPWLRAVFEGGALNHFDAVTVHPYRSDSPETWLGDFASLTDLVREYAPLNADAPPVLSGEWGYDQRRLGPTMLQNDTFAHIFVRQMLTTITSTSAPSIWYEWRDNAGEKMGVVDMSFNPDHKPPFTPKKAYVAAQVLSKQLQGFTFDTQIPVYQSGSTTRDDVVLRFVNSAGVTALAAWTSGSFPHVVRLPGGAGCWDVVDFKGAPQPTICEDPRGIHVNVSSAPLYLIQAAAEQG